MLTKEEVLELMANTETFRVEKTISTTNMDKFGEAICAFIAPSDVTVVVPEDSLKLTLKKMLSVIALIETNSQVTREEMAKAISVSPKTWNV